MGLKSKNSSISCVWGFVGLAVLTFMIALVASLGGANGIR